MDDRLTGEFDDDGAQDDDETRYGLTLLGATHLERRRSFVGFGPCSAMRPSEAVAPASSVRRRIKRAGKRTTPLFG